MIIRSQDKRNLTTDINLKIHVNTNEGSIFRIYNQTVGVIGVYTTEEKAIKVLNSICDEYQYCEKCKCNGTGGRQPEFVFQMPQDNEIDE